MTAANNGTWTHTRLRKDTLDRLKAFGRRMDRRYARGQAGPEPGDQGFSIDLLLTILLDREDDHVERSKRASMRRRYRAVKEARASGESPCYSGRPEAEAVVTPPTEEREVQWREELRQLLESRLSETQKQGSADGAQG